MRKANKVFITVYVCAALLSGYHEALTAENMTRPKQVFVRIPAFSMNPGEKIVGVRFILTAGSFTHGFATRGWNCQLINTTRTEQLFECSSPHTMYAITNAAKMPVLTVDDLSDRVGKAFSVEALIELENGSGSRFTKQFSASDLAITR